MRRIAGKSKEEVELEWDAIAASRSRQIRDGLDISHDFVLAPTILDLISDCDLSSVLDVGCGCGHLTAKIAAAAGTVVGVDVSGASIDLARVHCRGHSNVRFVKSDIESIGHEVGTMGFSLAIANMSLMAIIQLDSAIESLACQVRPGGHLAFTITHPCFWPLYWMYSSEWFSYSEECVIEAPFHISLDSSDQYVTTHVHRPLERYVSAFSDSGFRICRLTEPIPSREVESKYPHRWAYPRFLAGLCVRIE
jgi:SAM-dependent methyltransferase